jgi:leucine carboxyl methyltransferase
MDTRPYRMDLSASLHWVEVDHPSLIESKNAQLSTELPGVFDRTGRSGPGRPPRPPATLRPDLGHLNESDGPHGRVLGALSADEAGGLADDLRARPGCESWVIDDFSARLSRRIGSTSRIPMSRSVSIHPAGRRSSPNTAGVPRRSVSLGGVRTLHRPVPLSRLDKVMPLFTSRPLRGHGRASSGSDEEVLKSAVHAVAEQAANTNKIIDEAIDAAGQEELSPRRGRWLRHTAVTRACLPCHRSPPSDR